MIINNVLVTGCGGDIGLGIARILKKTGSAKKVIGCDVNDTHPGYLVYDEYEIIKPANHPEYFSELEAIINKHKIDLIIPISEQEIRVFFKNKILTGFKSVPVIMPNEESLVVGLDKLKTMEFLKKNNLLYPWTKIVKDGKPEAIPCIIKDRGGHGSKGIHVVEKELVAYYEKKFPEHIWQELLLPDDQEYTCGLYRTQKGEIRDIIFKRKLQGGLTGSGEVVEDKSIEKALKKIANAIKLRGSINVQLRLTDRGPVVFEINPRFSSTVVFRHLLGFQDLIWSLQEKAGMKISDYKPPLVRTKIFKGSHEYIIKPKK